MRKLILLFIVLLISVWLGLYIISTPSYLLLVYKSYRIEMPLWFSIIAILLLFSVLYFILRLSYFFTHLFDTVKAWQKTRREKSKIRNFHEGLRELMMGRWSSAEKLLLKAARSTPRMNNLNLLAYLALAKTAQDQGALTRRDNYLRQAEDADPLAQTLVSLTQAQLQTEQNQWECALASLERVKMIAPTNLKLAKLLYEVYKNLKNWPALFNLLPMLAKAKLLPVSEWQKTAKLTYYQVLKHYMKANNLVEFEKVWHQLPATLQYEEKIIVWYATLLNQLKLFNKAEYLLRKSLDFKWCSEWIELYGVTISSDLTGQLRHAEQWLKKHPNHAMLLLTLGRLCLHAQLWGKARTYLENSIAIFPTPITYLELAQLLEKLDDPKLSYQYYRQGLKLATRNLNRPLA